MLKPRFSAEINFGHIMQAAVLLLTVGGGAVTSYISLRGDIDTLRSDLGVQIASHELRIRAAEHAVEQRRLDEHEFRLRCGLHCRKSSRLLQIFGPKLYRSKIVNKLKVISKNPFKIVMYLFYRGYKVFGLRWLNQ